MAVDTDLVDDGLTRQVEIPAPHRDAEQAVMDLLRGASPPQQPAETPSPADAPPETVEIPDLKTLAEKLRVDPAKLYELKVAMTDGSELPIGALKDAYQPAAEVEKARKSFVEEQTAWATERETAHRELNSLLQLLGPQNLKPEFLAEAARLSQEQRQKESEKLLKTLPEWKDEVTKAADWADIAPTAREYGFTEADIGLAKQGFADSRFLKMARDLAKFKAREKAQAAKPAQKVAVKPKAGPAPTEAQQHGYLKAAVTKGQIGQVDAVSRLLKGAGVK